MLKVLRAAASACALVATLTFVAPVRADDIDAGDANPVIAGLLADQADAVGEVAAPLWKYRDADLQAAVDAALRRLHLDRAAESRRLAVALVDTTDADRPRVAAVNGDLMMYAASLPKIAILFAAFDMAERGRLKIHRVGVENIARALMSPRYRFYDPDRNGGLWVGKDYGKAGLWQRDPLHSLS